MRRLIRIFLVPTVFAVGIVGSLYSSGGQGDIAKEFEMAITNDLDAVLTTLETCDTSYTRIGADSVMIVTCTDTVPEITREMWGQCLDWGPDGNLWVGTYWAVGETDFRVWYAIDVATNAIVDSFGTPVPITGDFGTWTVEDHVTTPRDSDSLRVVLGDSLAAPRAVTWTANGDTMYTADFDGNVIKMWTKPVAVWTYVEDVITGPSPHGVVVAPDGKIWIGWYGYTDSLFGATDTVRAARITVLNADHTEASFSPILTVTVASEIDTLDGCTGMVVDPKTGDILYSDLVGGNQTVVKKPSALFRIDHKTGAGLDKLTLSAFGTSSSTEAGVDTFGYVYLAEVVPDPDPILIYAGDDFTQSYGFVDAANTVISRTLAASQDGNDIYQGAIYEAVEGVYKYHSDNGADGPYTCVDTLGTIFDYVEKVTIDTTVIPPVGVDPYAGVPRGYALSQNFPNPFNPATWINYQLPKTELASLTIYNLLGQEVRTLVNDVQVAGEYALMWDGTNERGARVPSGIYIYRLKTGTVTLSKRMVLLK